MRVAEIPMHIEGFFDGLCGVRFVAEIAFEIFVDGCFDIGIQALTRADFEIIVFFILSILSYCLIALPQSVRGALASDMTEKPADAEPCEFFHVECAFKMFEHGDDERFAFLGKDS